MQSARDRAAAVEDKDFRDQRRELEEKEFWLDTEYWDARVDACVAPDRPQATKTESRSK